MSGFRVELPEALVQRLEQGGMTSSEVETLVIQLVRAFLAEQERTPGNAGAAFARRVIANNRELFLELAQR